MTTSTIPTEAIDAAMEAIESHMDGPIRLHDLALAALEAAAPHLTERAYNSGHLAGMIGAPNSNPYRPH